MGLNVLALPKMKKRLELFREQHPKFLPFLKKVRADALAPGTVLEIKATTADGKEIASNIRLTAEDVETVDMLFN